MRFEHVTYRPEGASRARSMYLENTATITIAGEQHLTGTEVDRTGDEVSGPGFDERRHVISLELVTARKPYRLDNTYGTLVPA